MGRPPQLTRDRILETALALADHSGLGAVTMHGVAAGLGVTPMALYRHVGDKAALLDGLVERVLTQVQPPSPGLSGPEQLVAMAHALRRTGQQHPGVFPLLLSRPAATPEARVVRNSVQRALADSGVDPGDVAQVERLVSTAVLGFIMSEVAGRFGRHSAAVVDADFERLLELLAGFVDPDPVAGRVPPEARSR